MVYHKAPVGDGVAANRLGLGILLAVPLAYTHGWGSWGGVGVELSPPLVDAALGSSGSDRGGGLAKGEAWSEGLERKTGGGDQHVLPRRIFTAEGPGVAEAGGGTGTPGPRYTDFRDAILFPDISEAREVETRPQDINATDRLFFA